MRVSPASIFVIKWLLSRQGYTPRMVKIVVDAVIDGVAEGEAESCALLKDYLKEASNLVNDNQAHFTVSLCMKAEALTWQPTSDLQLSERVNQAMKRIALCNSGSISRQMLETELVELLR